MERRPNKRGRAGLSDEQQKSLIVGGAVVLVFPFFWPAGFWTNLAVSLAAGALAYASTFAIIRRRNRNAS